MRSRVGTCTTTRIPKCWWRRRFRHTETGLLFIPVPEGKTAKNRVHLDIQPTEGTRDMLVELAVAKGNEFCITRSAAETKSSGPLSIRFEIAH